LIHILHILLSYFSRTANIIAFLLLAVSISAYYINPDYFWPIALFGLAYPVLLMINLFFVFSWVMRRRWFFLLSFLGILGSYPQLKGQLAFGATSDIQTLDHSLKVMSFNARNFDLYNWTKIDGARQSMFDSIAAVNPDVLCLQEFYTDTLRFQNTKILEQLGYRYHTMAVELVKGGHRKWGVAIFSKYPIIEQGEIIRQQRPSPYGKFPNRAAFADIDIKGQRIRFFSTHLQSIHFNLEDYETLKEIGEEQETEWRKYKGIIYKLARAFEQRGVQAVELGEAVKSSPHPVIICGDFNDTPSSYTYGVCSRLLNDAFLQAGKGIGSTYNGLIPFLRIDYIFADKSLTCASFHVNGNPHSDHFPLVAEFILPGSGQKK
jgi:endonuclease/exonuclease/phosphatase family metal-dependent hydrolase